MTAAYRLKGIGWMGGCVAIVLGFYLVSLQVAAERKRLETVDGQIATANRDIRALETEFDTRANLAQLEKWNGDTLALAAPTAGQFVHSEEQLAAMNPGGPGMPEVETAALVVPAMPAAQAPLPSTPAPAPVVAPAIVQVAAVKPAVAPRVMMAAVAAVPVATPTAVKAVSVREVASPAKRPAVAKLLAAVRGQAAVSKVRPQAVAMLDRKLLSDATLGEILADAKAEQRRR